MLEPGTPFIGGRHVVAMCAHLEAVTAGEIDDLIMNCPPGMSKSRLMSVIWPAWVWTKFPHYGFLCASYEQRLAIRDNTACRDLVQSDWYQERWGNKVRVKEDDNQKTKFVLTSGGWRMATTPRGRGTGEHPNIVIGDDLHNVLQAESDVQRTATLHWWDRTISVSRGVSKNSRRVIGMQRLGEADLSGHIRKTRPWAVHLVMPMEFDPALPHGSFRISADGLIEPTGIWDDDRTTEGELLCPELVPPKAVERLKATLMSRCSGQLQQNPLPDEGAILGRSMFRTFEVDSAAGSDEIFTLRVPDGAGGTRPRRYTSSQCLWFQAIDSASKDGEENDYTAIGTFCATPGGELLVYDVIRERIPLPRLYNLTQELLRRYPRVRMQAVEDKSSGEGLIQIGAERGTPFFPLKAKGSKKERAIPMATWYSVGRIFHRDAPWRGPLEDELVGFPDATHDDQWDMMAHGVNLLHTGVLASLYRLDRPLLVWPGPDDFQEPQPFQDEPEKTDPQFDFARRLGII